MAKWENRKKAFKPHFAISLFSLALFGESLGKNEQMVRI
jgi:hypothetical protein